MTWLSHLVQDLRYAMRIHTRDIGFTSVVALTLSLGIGMNTAVFSLVNAALLRPLSYPHPDRLVWLANFDPQFQQDTLVSKSDFLAWQAEARSFDAMAGYAQQDMAVATAEEATQERITSITGDFWTITGAQPAWGRLFAADERDAMILSYELFEQRFAGDPRIVGRQVRLEGRPITIVGVLPQGFRFLLPQLPGREPRETQAYIALPSAQAPGQPGPSASVVARLRPDISLARARAEMETIHSRRVRQSSTARPGERDLRVALLDDKLAAGSRRALGVLLAAVGFVLLIAGVNVASLLLARMSARYREVTIRVAVGAGRGRLMQQFLTESVVLALLGGAAGLAVAHAALGLMLRLAPNAVPRLSEATLDGRALAFTLLVSLATGILFGLSPALALQRASLNEILKDGAGTPGRRSGHLRALLVAVELALGIILLTGAGLMLKSFSRMHAAPAGFAPERIVAMRVSLSGAQYGARSAQAAYMQELLRRVEALPGLESAGLDCGSFHLRATIEGAPAASPSAASPDAQSVVSFRAVSPGYLRAMGVRLVQGHWPKEADSSATNELLVNESFARRIAAGAGSGNPVGRRITAGIGTLGGVIAGVVSDFKYWRLDAEPAAEVYTSYTRSPILRSVRVVLRTVGDPMTAAPAIRKVVAEIDRTQPVYELQTLEQALELSIAPRRFTLFLLATFALTALVLALIGIHGVVAYSVSERTHEIGVRMALGAERGDVVRMLVRNAMSFVLAGITAGLAAAAGLTRLMAALLYDVTPNDPATFAMVASTMAATALVACWLPAAKAARLDPIVALRHD